MVELIVTDTQAVVPLDAAQRFSLVERGLERECWSLICLEIEVSKESCCPFV